MPFNKPYEFDSKNIVVIEHWINGQHLRVKPNQLQQLSHNGGKGELSRFEADPQNNGTKVRLKSIKTNNFLRIMKNKRNNKYIVNCGGSGGKFTVFNIHYVDQNNITNGHIKLESNVFPGIYIAVNNDGICTANGDNKWCEMKIYQYDDDGTTTEDDDDDDDDDNDNDNDFESEPEEEDYEDVINDVYIEDDDDMVIIREDNDGSVIVHDDDEYEEKDDDDDDDKEDLLSDYDIAAKNAKLLEGYCLVFEREKEYHVLEVVDLEEVGEEKYDLSNMEEMCGLTNVHGISNDNNKGLSWVRKPDIAEQEYQEKACKTLRGTDTLNLLKGFNAAHIQYKIIWSRPSLERVDEEDQINPNDDIESKYIYIIIWIDEKYAESYADYQDVSVLINREEAIKAGRQFQEFHLAKRTYLAGVDQDNKIRIDEDDDSIAAFARKKVDDKLDILSSVQVQGFGSNDIVQQTTKTKKIENEIEMLPIECWNNIHIPFEYSIKSDSDQYNIYELVASANNPSYKTVVTHRMYLRILYSCLVDDRSMKGADFLVDYYLKDKNHPFVTIFALHEFDNNKFYPVRSCKYSPKFAHILYKFPSWIRKSEYIKLNDDIREYYGEYIAFYYAFLTHYIQSMLPMVIIGLIWFIVQLIANTVSVAGSTFYVLICVIWSTLLIETWYRREGELRYKWGMCRYRETEVPRPTFSGKVKVSEYNGDIIEDHKNMLYYWLRIIFSLTTMFLCIFIVIVIVGSIWILKKRWKDDPGYKMAIGIINAIQIKIFNVLYTKLAYYLNDFEQHRLVEDYYNHLVIKRIIFMVVNSFNSLFYIAFYDDSYIDNQDRLNSLRIQLLTLFVTSIILLNFLEIIFPKIPEWIRLYKLRKKRKEAQKTEGNNDDNLPKQIKSTIHVPTSSNIKMLKMSDNIDENEELADPQFTGGLDGIIILDIEKQINSPSLPSTLDNVAEIVILQGYIIMFAIVLPIMPLLAYINAIFEIRIDIYNLTASQRPFPLGADGIGVWRAVLSIFNTMSIFSNMAVIAWDTNLPEVVLGLKLSGKIIWYFLICLAMLIAMVSIRLVLPNESIEIKKAMSRQEQCENLVTLLQDSAPNKDTNKIGQKKELIQIK